LRRPGSLRVLIGPHALPEPAPPLPTQPTTAIGADRARGAASRALRYAGARSRGGPRVPRCPPVLAALMLLCCTSLTTYPLPQASTSAAPAPQTPEPAAAAPAPEAVAAAAAAAAPAAAAPGPAPVVVRCAWHACCLLHVSKGCCTQRPGVTDQCFFSLSQDGHFNIRGVMESLGRQYRSALFNTLPMIYSGSIRILQEARQTTASVSPIRLTPQTPHPSASPKPQPTQRCK
jgi:hypothetical protein